MISIDEAYQKFKSIIGEKSSWLQIASSQFVHHLSVFVGWALRQALWKIERALQEFFLSTALNRSSILAHVEDRDYVPQKAQPSTGVCQITNKGDDTVSIPAERAFLSNAQVDYICDNALVLTSGQVVTDVAFSQLKIESVEYDVTEESVFYEILFDTDISAKIHSFEVYVDDEKWDLAKRFLNTTSTSKVYDEFYSHTDKTGIRFGNGIFGMIPPIDAVVRIDFRLTDGDTFLNENQELYIVDELLDYSGNPANLEVVTDGAITGGSDMEATETIRRNLLYWPIYNDQLVWDNDYIYYVKKNFPDVVWINVWGEKEAEEQAGAPDLDFINKVFVSAYAPDTSTLSTDVLAALDGTEKTNRVFEWVDPVFQTFTVTITGKVSSAQNISTVLANIETALEEDYGKDSGSRKDHVLLSDVYNLIAGLGYFADSDEAYYIIEITGDTEPEALENMVHIDLESSTIEIEYLV